MFSKVFITVVVPAPEDPVMAMIRMSLVDMVDLSGDWNSGGL